MSVDSTVTKSGAAPLVGPGVMATLGSEAVSSVTPLNQVKVGSGAPLAVQLRTISNPIFTLAVVGSVGIVDKISGSAVCVGRREEGVGERMWEGGCGREDVGGRVWKGGWGGRV